MCIFPFYRVELSILRYLWLTFVRSLTLLFLFSCLDLFPLTWKTNREWCQSGIQTVLFYLKHRTSPALCHSSLISLMGKLLPVQQLCNEVAAKNRGIGVFLNMHCCAPKESKKMGICHFLPVNLSSLFTTHISVTTFDYSLSYPDVPTLQYI